ncbi:hypothetical protein ACOJBM_40565 [Rhizobium beringeri]
MVTEREWQAPHATLFSVGSGQLEVDEAMKRYPDLAKDPAEFREGMARLREEAKTSPAMLDSMKAVVTMCDHPSEENYLAVTSADHAKDMKTCQVSSNPCTQEFEWVADYGNGGAWVVSARGAMRIVQLSRFETDRKRRPSHTLTKKLATNSSAAAITETAASRRQLRSD